MIMMILRPPLFFGLLATVAMTTNSASSACFGGVPTYEKSTGYSSTAPMGPRLATNTRSVLDCLSACSNLETCKAFKMDHKTGECWSFTEDRSTTGSTDVLTPELNVNYFEKMCLMVNITYFRTMCAEKKWAFQRVKGAYLDFPPSKKVRVSSRTECARICFVEKDFTCRSANFDKVAFSCELLQEDRRTQSTSFRRDENRNKDYLENQCSVRVIQSCQYDSKQNMQVANPDHEVYAPTHRACIALCDGEKMFFCRSYSFNATTNICQLSGDDKASMTDTGSSPMLRQGVVSGERACILLRCAGNTVSYERVTGRYIPSASQEPILAEGKSFSSISCLRSCTNSGSYCPGLHVDYKLGHCYKLDRNTQSSGTYLLPKHGISYFEQVCLPSAGRYCSDKAWAFERLQGFEMIQSSDDKILSPTQNRLECEEACLKALDAGFICRSATYDGNLAECRLSRSSRRTQPRLLRATRSSNIEYLENQCVASPITCQFSRVVDFLPPYPDVTLTDVISAKECQRACDSAKNFTCRGAGYLSSRLECKLSGNAQDGNPLEPHGGAEYFDKSCAPLNDGDLQSTEDPLVTFSPVSSGGKCVEGSRGLQSYERTTGFTIKQEGPLIYNSIGSGIVAQCKQLCDKDKTCNGFTIDYMRSRCYAINTQTSSDLRNHLEMVPSSSIFEAVCSLPVPRCRHLWNFERILNKEMRGFDHQIHKGISKAECQQRCLAERRFQCRSASYSETECRLSAEDRMTQPNAFVDADGVDYLENQCALPTWRYMTPTLNAGGKPAAQNEDCTFTNRVEGSALDYVDKISEVNTEQECRDKCRLEIEFNCRSISFINQGAGKITCYLSAETSSSMGAMLRPVPASIYEEIICRTTSSTFRPSVNPLPNGEATTCETADEYTFERVMGMLPKVKPSSEIMVPSAESPTSDCLRECLRAGDKCQGVAVHYSGGAPYSSPCSAYDKIISTDPRNLSPRADTAYYSKICIKGISCSSRWTVERVPGYALIGFDSRRLPNIATREECMEKCFTESTCRSVQYFPRARACHLSSETRRSQPFAFRFQGGDVQYMENQCTQDPSSCNFLDMPNMFLPYADRSLTSISSLSDCKQECSQEQDFMCRSVAFDSRARTCSLSACDRRCNPSARAILIQKTGSTYSERSSCSPQRPVQPMPPLPRPPFQPFPPPRPFPPQPMRPFPPQPLPYPPPMPPPVPVSVLGRNAAERRQDIVSSTNCIPLYIRTTGMAPSISPSAQLNVSGPIGTTYDCSTECTRWKDQCVAFTLQAGDPPCFAFDSVTDDLQQQNGVAYFRKQCFKGSKCSKLWAFDHMRGYEIEGFDTRKILNVNSLNDCAEICFQETAFSCRSAEYIGGERICHLSSENRHTRPDSFSRVADNDIDYLENQCSQRS